METSGSSRGHFTQRWSVTNKWEDDYFHLGWIQFTWTKSGRPPPAPQLAADGLTGPPATAAAAAAGAADASASARRRVLGRAPPNRRASCSSLAGAGDSGPAAAAASVGVVDGVVVGVADGTGGFWARRRKCRNENGLSDAAIVAAAPPVSQRKGRPVLNIEILLAKKYPFGNVASFGNTLLPNERNKGQSSWCWDHIRVMNWTNYYTNRKNPPLNLILYTKWWSWELTKLCMSKSITT